MKRSFLRSEILPLFHGNRSLALGIALTSLFIMAALLSFVWTPYDVTALDVSTRLTAPSTTHWFGANHLGRDVLSMTMVGARISIAVAFIAVGLGGAIGVPLGLLAAAKGGLIDDIVMRFGDLVFAFPALILAILITAVFGPSATNAIIAIGIFNIPVFARLTRSAALPIWHKPFVQAAQCAGKNLTQISAQHIFPNIRHVLIVQGTVQFALAILAEAGLSYVGLGAQPPIPSWGRMLAESQTMISTAPWLVLFPGVAIFVFVLGLNLLGDGLRHHYDPRRQRGF
ncbi:MAG: peptide ABC transporter permease [Hyphococcus sp.]|nr:MAG: peptide ABC transporter permease [Marinicaulis sp.]